MAAEHELIGSGINRSYVLKTSCGCHLHLVGIRVGDGYAQVKRCGRMHPAHRLAWLEAKGPIPPGLMVCHSCDVRCCVNLKHLFLGTAKDNAIDRQHKGRSAPVSLNFINSGLGVKRSPETRALLSEANRRRVITPETRAKRSANAIRQWRGRK